MSWDCARLPFRAAMMSPTGQWAQIARHHPSTSHPVFQECQLSGIFLGYSSSLATGFVFNPGLLMIGPYCLGSIKTTTMTLSIASFIHIKFGIWCLANLSLISHVANHSGPSLEGFCEKKRSFMPSDVRRFKITWMPKEEKATSLLILCHETQHTLAKTAASWHPS